MTIQNNRTSSSAKRPATSTGLGISGGPHSSSPAVTNSATRSVSNSKASTTNPCAHTTRQFSSHIDRCEACRLKQARQAEIVTIPYTQIPSRHTATAANTLTSQRSASRQSVKSTISRRPASSASFVTSSSGHPHPSRASSALSMTPTTAHMPPRPRTRTVDGIQQSHTGLRARSSSTGSPLSSSKTNPLQIVMDEPDSLFMNDELPSPITTNRPMPLFSSGLQQPSRNDGTLSTISSSANLLNSPTESLMAVRSRNRANQSNTSRRQESQGSSIKSSSGSTKTGQFRSRSRRNSASSMFAHVGHNNSSSRHAEDSLSIGAGKNRRRSGGGGNSSIRRGMSNDNGYSNDHGSAKDYSVAEPIHPSVDMDSVLMSQLVNDTRNQKGKLEEYRSRISQLEEENRRLRRKSARSPKALDSPSPAASNQSFGPEPVGRAIFQPDEEDARKSALDHIMDLDSEALKMYETFQKVYEDNEHILRDNPAHFAGERPLSPPPIGGSYGGGAMPIRAQHQLDIGSDQKSRMASFNAAEARRAGEDLMSTPKRPRAQRFIHGSLTGSRRKSRARPGMMGTPVAGGRKLFSDDRDSDLSDPISDNENGQDGFDKDLDDHDHLRDPLLCASRSGTYLVQYITRLISNHSTVCEELKKFQIAHGELEKQNAQLEKTNKRLGDSFDAQSASYYELGAEKDRLAADKEEVEKRERRLFAENQKLSNELNTSNERGQKLEDQVKKTSESHGKSRQNYEKELVKLRRNTNALQQDKTTLSKSNDELRIELKGKLQRAGLKANVDEYMAERRKEHAAAAAAAGQANGGSTGTGSNALLDGAAAEQEIKRLQEKVLMLRKKTDRMKRKMTSETKSKNEAVHALKDLQDENGYYRQTFGPLPDDVMSSIGDYPRSALADELTVSKGVGGSGSDSDENSGTSVGERSDHGSLFKPDTKDSAGVISAPIFSASGTDEDDAEDADDEDIRRYEERMRTRQALRATPGRNKSNSIVQSSKDAPAGAVALVANDTSRRTKNATLSIDVEAGAGESLGDILGTGTQWDGPPLPFARSKGATSVHGHHTPTLQSSLANELGGLDVGFSAPSPSKATKQLDGADADFGSSQMLSGQLRGATIQEHTVLSNEQADTVADKPKMVDSGVNTDILLEHLDAMAQTQPTETNNAATQMACSSTAEQQLATDPSIGVRQFGVGMDRLFGEDSVQAQPISKGCGIETDLSSAKLAHKSTDNIPQCADATISAMPFGVNVDTSTDPLFGTVSVGTSSEIVQNSVGCQVKPEETSRSMVTESGFGGKHQYIEFIPATRDMETLAGAATSSLRDSEMETRNMATAGRGIATVEPSTSSTGAGATSSLETCNVGIATDDSLLMEWLAPLIPAGIETATVVAALERQVEPVHEMHARQVAEATRATAEADQVRKEIQAAEEAALNVKVSSDKSVSPSIPAQEQAVQAEPKLTSTYQQAGLEPTADMGVNTVAGPVLHSVGVGTERKYATRWVEPFDPVAKLNKQIVAEVDTADHTTSHDVDYVEVAAGPTVEVASSEANATTQLIDRVTDMGIVTQDAASGTGIKLKELYVSAGMAETKVAGVSALVPVSAKATGSTSQMANKSVSNVIGTNASCVVANTDTTDRAVGSETPTTANANTQASPDLKHACVVTDEQVVTASVQVDASQPPTVAETISEDKRVVAVPSYLLPPIPYKTMSNISHRPSLPVLDPRSATNPDLLARSATSEALERQSGLPISAVRSRRESNGEDYGYIMVSPRTNVQRTALPTLASKRSFASIASTLAQRGKLRIKGSGRRHALNTIFGSWSQSQEDMTPGVDVHSAASNSRELGCDYGGDDELLSKEEDNDADSVHESGTALDQVSNLYDEAAAEIGMDMGTPSNLNQEQQATTKHMSMSVGVETTGDMMMSSSHIARQPEPMIVQAIARAMVGTYLYKYTATRFTHSNGHERRHLRYFWIHPYAKLLNWSKQPPSGGAGLSNANAGKRESDSRSAHMRSIRMVNDQSSTNEEEPHYFIIVQTDHREIKLKASTQADHDLWFVAMSYLQSRRIITSTTYPTVTGASAMKTHNHPMQSTDYFSEQPSLRDRGMSVGSSDSNHKVIMDADRRHRENTEMPTTSVVAASSVPKDSSGIGREQSLQSTPRSMRPVSMFPTATPPQPAAAAGSAASSASSSKRLSMGGLFRRGGGNNNNNGSVTSFFRSGGGGAAAQHTSDEEVTAHTQLHHQPSSIAMTMMSNNQHAPSSISSSSNTVRKMFSGSFLRRSGLRSRESVDKSV